MQRSGLPLLVIAGISLLVAAGVVLLVANPFAPGTRTAVTSTDSSAAPNPALDPATEPEEESATTDTGETEEMTDVPEPQSESESNAEPVADAPPEPQPNPEPEEEDLEEAPPEPVEQSDAGPRGVPGSTVTVREGDSLYSIAGATWSDPFLWPLLLVANDAAITDPDYLQPGSTITIPDWVDIESPLTPAHRDQLASAHVAAYQHYRDLGSDAVGLGQGQPEWWLDRLGRTRGNNARWVLYSGLRYSESLLDDQANAIAQQDLDEVRSYVDRFGLPPNRR